MSGFQRMWHGTVAALALLFLLGGLSGAWYWDRKSASWQQGMLVAQARAVARAINPQEARVLTFAAEDRQRPEYDRLHKQLQAYAKTANLHRLYVVAQRGGQWVMGPESLEENDAGVSPPGMVLRDPPAELEAVLKSGQAQTAGPAAGRGGKGGSAYVPVADPHGDKMLMVVGAEITVQQARSGSARTRWVPLFFAALLLTLLAVGQSAINSGRVFSVGRHGLRPSPEAVLAALLGLGITLAVAWHVNEIETLSRFEGFTVIARGQVADVEKMVQRLDHSLAGLGRFLELSSEIGLTQFQKYVEPVAKDALVQAWEWIPAVPAPAVAEVEMQARKQGLEGFNIFQKDDHGARSSASGRATNYPVLFAEPRGGNEQALGYDLGSEAVRRAALESAAHTGLHTATDPIVLVQETGHQLGILVFRPVFGGSRAAGHLRGYALVVLRLSTALQQSLHQTGNQETGITVDLLQLQTGRPPLVTASSADGAFHAAPRLDNPAQPGAGGLAVMMPFFVFGKALALRAWAQPGYVASNPLVRGWEAGLVGLLLTSLVTAFVAFLTRQRIALERAVQRRTAELRASEENLAATLRSIDDGVITTDEAGRVIRINLLAEQLTGWPAAEALGQPVESIFQMVHGQAFAEAENPVRRTLMEDRTCTLPDQSALLARDGSQRKISGSCSPIRAAEGQLMGTVLAFRDTTNEYQTQNRLRLLNERFSLAADAAGIGVWDWEVSENRLSWDSHMLSLYGLKAEDFTSAYEAWVRALHPEDAARSSEEIQMALKGQKEFDTEFRVVWPSGEVRHIRAVARVSRDEAGKPFRLTGVNYDITGRKLAEQKLRESEENFRTFFETVDDLIIVGTPQGHILYTNPAVTRKLGFSQEELGLLHILDLHQPEKRPEVERIFEAMLRGQSITCPLPLQAKNGVVLPVETRVWFGRWNGKDCVFGISKDLSRLESALQKFNRFFSSNPALMAVTSLPDRHFSEVNDSFLIKLGYSREEVVGKTSQELGLFAQPHENALMEQQLKRDGRFRNHELTVRAKDGRILVGLFSGEVIETQGQKSLLTVMVDITEQKQAEEFLRASEERLVRIIEATRAGTWEWDFQTGLAACNARWAAIVGYSLENLSPLTIRTWQDTTHPEDLQRCQQQLQQHFAGELPYYDMEYRMRHRDGRWVWVHDRGKVIKWTEAGQPWLMAGAIMDITERKQAEDQLQQTNRHLEEATSRANEMALLAQKANAAKSEFVANMSHEIRTPVSGIVGMIQLLLETSLDAEQRRFATIARASAEILSTLLNDILDFSKIEARKLELECIDFDLLALVEDVTEMFAARAQEKDLDLACAFAPGTPTRLRGDPERLRQILVNLVGNAVKFTETGSVVLRVGAQSESEAQVTLHFVVADTGIGISEQQLSGLFSPFVQADGSTNRRYGGTGLGLAICKRLVELMGGAIGAESESGRGSAFFFRLPCARQTTIAPVLLEAPPIAKLNLLVVDRHAQTRAVVKGLLEYWGARCGEVDTLEAALDSLRKAAAANDAYRVILLDVSGGGDLQAQLAPQIRSEKWFSQARLILVNVLGAPSLPGEWDWLGPAALLYKPLRQGALRDALQNALGGGGTAVATAVPRFSALPATDIASQLAGYKVLLVEDNPTNQELAMRVLKKLSVLADAASNGLEALEMLRKVPYDLVLMDCQMPEMDGYETTRKIRDPDTGVLNSLVPVIALTANAMAGDREKSLRAGMDDHLTKPFDTQKLSRMLLRWLRPDNASVPAQAEGMAAETPLAPDPLEPARPLNQEEFLRRCDGDLETARRIAALFLEDLPKQLVRLREAFKQGDFQNVRAIAHRIRGGASTISAGMLVMESDRVEKAPEQDLREKGGAWVDRLEFLFQLVKEALGDTQCG
jgi:PAS domain S-box-containing protein